MELDRDQDPLEHRVDPLHGRAASDDQTPTSDETLGPVDEPTTDGPAVDDDDADDDAEDAILEDDTDDDAELATPVEGDAEETSSVEDDETDEPQWPEGVRRPGGCHARLAVRRLLKPWRRTQTRRGRHP